MGSTVGAGDRYRMRAEECFQLAKDCNDPWVEEALASLGYELLEAAEDEQPSPRAHAHAPAVIGAHADGDESTRK